VRSTALIQVLGAVAYGELKAYEGASQRASLASEDSERLVWRRQAAEELRHYKGFVRRLEALGADPERAMRPYRRALDAYHAGEPDGLDGAMWDYLGEGVADDLLRWLRTVVDPETAEFIETVQADEVNHEARAAADLKVQLRTPLDHLRATLATARMVGHMIGSGGTDVGVFLAFARLGRTPELLGALFGGQARRLRAIGLRPFGLPIAA
jgi:hypothetical protein